MRGIIFFLLFFMPLFASSQWSITNGIIDGGRNDDIYFVNDSIGYVAGGNSNHIYKTTDSGNNWSAIYHDAWSYFRSIQFLDDSIGFQVF